MDLRIEKTYRALLTAFTDLLETHRYEDVTVAMLCDEAMIRRTTFYKHFSDKAEFFSFYLSNLRINLLKRGDEVEGRADGLQGEEQASQAIFKGLVEFMHEHEALVDNIFESQMTGMLMLAMEDAVAEAVRDRYAHLVDGTARDGLELEAMSEFAAGGIVRLLQLWWSGGRDEVDEQDFINASSRLVGRVMGLAQA